MEEKAENLNRGKESFVTINRRGFIKLTGAVILLGCTGALCMSACSSWRDECYVPLAPEGSYRSEGGRVILLSSTLGSLAAEGSAVKLVFVDEEEIVERLIVIHSEDGKHHAFVDHCTHNMKELYYLREDKLLRCFSGKSYFDMEGNVMRGPAEKPLHGFPIWQEADRVIIEMKSGG
jgi:nitrite reductase/ring-hydroxylating ferredoxin subunit